MTDVGLCSHPVPTNHRHYPQLRPHLRGGLSVAEWSNAHIQQSDETKDKVALLMSGALLTRSRRQLCLA